MKGEGEVKLNLAIGKGDQASKSSNKEGQQAIQDQLETLKKAWADAMSSAVHAQRCKNLPYVHVCPNRTQWCHKLTVQHFGSLLWNR